MSAIVVDDCDCASIPRIGFPGLVLQTFADEIRACVAWLAGDALWRRSFDEERPHGERYYCVHYGRRHVIGVRP